jgi:hypothetical protein
LTLVEDTTPTLESEGKNAAGDEPLEVLVVHQKPDGTFAAADALQKLRIIQDGFKTAAEAEKFIENFYLARGVIRPRKSKQ